MPEAAIDEHGHPGSREDHVRLNASAGSTDQEVLAEAKAPTVEVRAQQQLGLRAGALVPLADASRRLVLWRGIGHADASAEGDGPAFRCRCVGAVSPRFCHTPRVY